MTADRSPRFLVTTEPRPLRLAVVLDAPVSRQGYRRALRVLTGTWGGVRSAVVTSGGDVPGAKSIDERWIPTVRAMDPDVVYVPRRLAGLRAREDLGRSLDRVRINPRWIVPITDRLTIEPGWNPQPVGAYLPEGSIDSEDFAAIGRAVPRRLSPVLEALLGLPMPPAPSGRRRVGGITRARGLSVSVVRGSPIARSASVTPLFETRPLGFNPFFLYDADDVETGLWLWNLRALRGGFRHGTIDELERYLRQIQPITRSRRVVVHLGALPPQAQRLVDDAGLGGVVRFVLSDQYAPARFGLGLARERERDEIVSSDGTLAVPARRPGLSPSPTAPAASLGTTGRLDNGVFAVDIAIEPLEEEGLALSHPPRSALHDAILATDRLARSLGLERSYPRTRVAGNGNLVIVPAPGARSRSIPLLLPSMADILGRLDPSARYEPSDKGRYARWMVSELGLAGLHELLVDSRSRALLEALRQRRQRFMTLDEMRQEFVARRSSAALPRAPRLASDEQWLGAWVPRQVAAKVLRQGIAAKCHECLAESFLAFGSFTASFSCPRCGASAATPSMPRVGYQLGEVPYQFLTNNGGVSALALAAIGRRASAGFSYDFDHIIKRPQTGRRPPTVNELDLFAIVDGRVVIGEAKTNGAFDDGDFRVLRDTARRLAADVVVLAADQACDGGCTDACGGAAGEPISYTRDSCLGRGGGTPGPREKMEKLRSDLLPRDVVVLCRGSLVADFGVGGLPF